MDKLDPIVIFFLGLTGFLSLVSTALSVALAGKQLFFTRDSGKELVTRGELREEMASVRMELAASKMDSKNQVESLKSDLTGRLDKIEVYSHQISHSMRNDLYTLTLKMQTALVMLEHQTGMKIAMSMPTQQDPGNPQGTP